MRLLRFHTSIAGVSLSMPLLYNDDDYYYNDNDNNNNNNNKTS